MPTQLDITVHDDDDEHVIQLAGSLCTSTAGRFQETVSGCLAQKPCLVRFDLRDAYLDSFGLATLINVVKQCSDAADVVEIVSPPATREVLSCLGFPQHFRLEADATVRVLATQPR